MQVALKCADVGHLALPKEQHMYWVDQLQEEFFLQGQCLLDEGPALADMLANNTTCHCGLQLSLTLIRL